MNIRHTIAASVALAAVGFSLASAPAYAADNIVLDQWYSFYFADNPPPASPIFGDGVALGIHGPFSGGFESAIGAPISNPGSWTITMSTAGYVTFTDLQVSGDQFNIFVNGVSEGLTSTPIAYPNPGSEYGVEDIAYALGDSTYSHGSFYLAPGVDTITGNFEGVIANGYGAFYVNTGAVPEPATWAMFLLGFGSIGFMLRNRRKGAAATA